MKGKLLLASLVLLGGCTEVPDFMVEGRLPHFGDRPTEMAQEEAPAPTPVATPVAGPATEVPAPPPAPPVAAQSGAAPPPPAMRPSAVMSRPAEAPKAKPTPAVVPSPPPAPKLTKAPPPEPYAPMVGGFQPATDKEAVARAAAFAVHESPGYLLKSIKSARTQVVAGLNYDLCLKVRTPGHEASWFRQRYVVARVYQALDQHYELVSWKEVDACS